MNYCLGKDELALFFDAIISRDSLENVFEEDLQIRINACMNWEDTLGVLIYTFTHFLQKKLKAGGDANIDYVNHLFDLINQGNFIIETIDRSFIEYMLNYNRTKIKEDLSDSLIIILQNYLDHSYDSSLCF